MHTLKGCERMNNMKKGAIAGALIGDAFALGPHWLYDTSVVEKHFGKMTAYKKPMAPYHKGKKPGDFTHYGDQTYHLLNLVTGQDRFDIKAYKEAWIKFVETTDMYMDHATKSSLDLLKGKTQVTGSISDELGGMVRGVALYGLNSYTLEDFINQTRLTHTDEGLKDVVEFFYHVMEKVFEGQKPSEAIEAVNDQMENHMIDQALRLSESHEEADAVTAISAIGQSCSSKYGLPASIFLINKYEEDFVGAMKANILAGGDSAARGMAVGMVLGAYHGYEHLPKALLEGLNVELF